MKSKSKSKSEKVEGGRGGGGRKEEGGRRRESSCTVAEELSGSEGDDAEFCAFGSRVSASASASVSSGAPRAEHGVRLACGGLTEAEAGRARTAVSRQCISASEHQSIRASEHQSISYRTVC